MGGSSLWHAPWRRYGSTSWGESFVVTVSGRRSQLREVPLVGVTRLYGAILQIPGMGGPDLTLMEQLEQGWADMGFMRWPLAVCLVLAIIVISILPAVIEYLRHRRSAAR